MGKILCKLIFIFCMILAEASPVFAANDHTDSVIKIFTTSNSMDYYRPWQSKGSESSTGSGAVISGNRILTNAHVVADHTFIQVRKESNPVKYTARVLALGYDCDLAILTVDDPEFFKDTPAFEFGDLPKLQDSVTVIGFPLGGDKLSITEGVVSRIEIIPYVESAKNLLGVQIDAAINPGNSGGPVLQNGKIVGIAMQSIVRSQSIGFMIPTIIVKHFLKDLESGVYEGFPSMGIEYHSTENKTLRKYFKVSDKDGGVLISHVQPFFPAYGQLQEGDVIQALDNVPVGVDGTFEFRNNERLGMSYLVNEKQVGDEVVLKIIRNGEEKKQTIKLTPYNDFVAQPHRFEKPPYYIYGGLVFTVLSMDLLKAWDNEGDDGRYWNNSPLDFLYYLVGDGRLNLEKKKEIVVLLNVLPDDITVGYHDYYNKTMTRVNGQTFDSFEQFVTLLEENKDEYTIFETAEKLKIVIDNKDIDTLTRQIIERNNIPSRSSDDVAEWVKKVHSKSEEISSLKK